MEYGIIDKNHYSDILFTHFPRMIGADSYIVNLPPKNYLRLRIILIFVQLF
jgi:hypothetical protein